MEQMKDQMQGQMNDPKYAHELKRRPISKNSDLTGTTMSGEGQNMSLQEDNYAYGLYHYGYGYFDYGSGGVDENSGYDAVFAEDLEDDRAYRQMYPELSHGLGIYGGKLYFNISNKILCYDLKLKEVTQVKEYNDVYANLNDDMYNQDGSIMTDNNQNVVKQLFTGMFFDLTDDSENAEYSFRYRPLAGLSIHDKFVMGEESVSMVPTMFVAVGTNLTESYGDPNYTTEALNYNPNYQRFMDDDKTDGENTNVEFMWCANLTEEMDMATLLDELVNGETVEVTVDAYCEKDAFTETRTANYGLSDGTTKVVTEKSALKHSYEWNETEQMCVCENCNHCVSDRPAALPGDVDSNEVVDVDDLASMARYLGGYTDDNFSIANGDYDNNGIVDVDDLTAIARYLGGY